MRRYALLPLFALILAACGRLSSVNTATPLTSPCPPLPPGFTPAVLIGEWQARYGASTDTIYLRNNGTYDQTYVRDTDGYTFRNDGNVWKYEAGEGGQSYLRLQGMRRCDNTDELCESTSGGGGSFHYWDFCLDRAVEMPREVILMVTGTPKGAPVTPVGIILWHMAPSADAGSFWFAKVEK